MKRSGICGTERISLRSLLGRLSNPASIGSRSLYDIALDNGCYALVLVGEVRGRAVGGGAGAKAAPIDLSGSGRQLWRPCAILMHYCESGARAQLWRVWQP